MRRLVCTTHCEMCLTEFWNLYRCIKRVDRASKQMYLIINFEYDEELVIRAEEDAALHRQHMEMEGRRKTRAPTDPVVRLHGPLPHEAAMRPRF